MAIHNPTTSDLENLTEFTTEDKLILLACRNYMVITNINADQFFEEIFDLASQSVTNLGENFQSATHQ